MAALTVAAGLSLAFLALDVTLPLGVAAGGLYLLVVVCALWTRSPNDAFWLAGISSVMIGIGFASSPEGGSPGSS